MDIAFWKERWESRAIGFHEGKPNELLAQHAHLLDGRKRVLVPLAGKSIDMLFLASQGHEVVGVEAVESACREFFDENGLAAARAEHAGGVRFTSGQITLWCGDMFAATRAALGSFDAVYDRAALVALEPSTRARYVDVIGALLEPSAAGSAARTLLVSFSYDQSKLAGPPWSVDEPEVRALWEPRGARVVHVVTREATRGPKFVEAGVEVVRESLFMIDG